MDWLPKDRYFSESGCGQYRISLAYVRGQAGYTVWHRGISENRVVWTAILHTLDHAVAQRACEELARRSRIGGPTDKREGYKT
jgi:hypothetical protein